MPTDLPTVQPIADVRLRVLQIAGGDAAYAGVLRTMMWDAYSDAGLPFGSDEDGMWRWWASDLRTTAQ